MLSAPRMGACQVEGSSVPVPVLLHPWRSVLIPGGPDSKGEYDKSLAMRRESAGLWEEGFHGEKIKICLDCNTLTGGGRISAF